MTDDIIRNVSFRRLRAVLALHETTLAVLAKKNGCTPSHLRFVMLGQRASSAALRAKLQRELSDDEWQFVRCEVDVLRGDTRDHVQARGGMPLTGNDTISTGRSSRAEVQLEHGPAVVVTLSAGVATATADGSNIAPFWTFPNCCSHGISWC